MSVASALRVLQWRWGLSPAESQAAEYAVEVGVESFERQWVGNDRSLRRVKRQLAKERKRAA